MLDIAAFGVYIVILVYAAVVDRHTLRIPNKLIVAIFLDWLVWQILRDALPRLVERGGSGLAEAGAYFGAYVDAETGSGAGASVDTGESLLTFLGSADASAASGALAAIVFGVGLTLFALVYETVTHKYSMGGGDIKLMAASALFLGLQRSFLALMIACIVACLFRLFYGIGSTLGIAKLHLHCKQEDLETNVSRETFSNDGIEQMPGAFPFGPAIAVGSIAALLL